MDLTFYLIFAALIGLALLKAYGRWQVARRARLIDSYRFPSTLTRKVREKYPHLSEQQAAQVLDGLREYFHLCNAAGRRMVSMPSQAVDVAWHEFILFTRQYERFCHKALGRFLHHTPAEAMTSPTLAQDGIKRAWRIACHRANIQPKSPGSLPTLFAMDAALEIPDGFRYSLDCRKAGSGGFCAGHIGCGSGCGGDSSGCGGDGCGGGCGGD